MYHLDNCNKIKFEVDTVQVTACLYLSLASCIINTLQIGHYVNYWPVNIHCTSSLQDDNCEFQSCRLCNPLDNHFVKYLFYQPCNN